MIKATWNNTEIAASSDTVTVEGNHYFPMTAVRDSYLANSAMTSFCPWKGIASYFHVVVDGAEIPDAAWHYKDPKEAAREIAGRIAFWRGVRVVD